MNPLVPLTDELIGPPLRQTLIELTGSTDDLLLDQLVERFKECYDTDAYRTTQVYDGVNPMLEYLTHKGIPLAIATNKRRVPTKKIINYLGWEIFFCFVGTLDSSTPPHVAKADLINFLLNNLSFSAETTVYVGDKFDDGMAAEANNISFCAANWGYGLWNEANMPRNWRLARSPKELTRQFFPAYSNNSYNYGT